MESEVVSVSRRSFLMAAATWLTGSLAACISPRNAFSAPQLDKTDIEVLQTNLLRLVNLERAVAGVSTLLIDPLASLVAYQHALDMATGRFLSHWGRDGRKPYHRYSFAGGYDAVAENVSAASNVESVDRKFIDLALLEAHRRMHDEIPPNDGHRRTVLAPQHTHLGFGIALSGRELRLVELYTAKYVQIDPFPASAKPKATVKLHGKLLNRNYTFYYVEVFYEPLPQSPDIAWLNVPRPYSLPQEFNTLRPKLPAGILYADAIEGTINVQDGKFTIPLKFDSRAGIYTVVIWATKKGSKDRYPVTNACIRVD